MKNALPGGAGTVSAHPPKSRRAEDVRRRMLHRALVGVLAALALPAVHAATLSIDMTVDNGFSLYLSTNDSAAGTLLGTGNDWTQTYSFSTTLAAGNTYYLHVVAEDWGYISGFIGDFSLTGGGFVFGNGSTFLVTDTDNWLVSTTGFGSGYTAPVTWSNTNGQGGASYNGVAPWYSRPGIDSNAQWIWAPNYCTDCTVYFSTVIEPVSSQGGTVPLPPTLWLLATGTAAMGLTRRRR